jgi:hypothetical protein
MNALSWIAVLVAGEVVTPPTEEVVLQREAEAEDVSPLSDTECAGIFGDEEEKGANEKWREEHPVTITETAHSITVEHSEDFVEPTPVKFAGLKLLRTFTDDDEKGYALVRVSESVAEPDCPAGVYKIHVDNSLGKNAATLAILSEIVVFEMDDNLHYLSSQNDTEPVFRMVWRSPWIHFMPPGYERTPPKPHVPPRVPRRR